MSLGRILGMLWRGDLSELSPTEMVALTVVVWCVMLTVVVNLDERDEIIAMTPSIITKAEASTGPCTLSAGRF